MEANRNRPELLERFWRLNPVPKKTQTRNHPEGWGSGSKLTEDDVHLIRIRHAAGETTVSIARDFPVDQKNIWRVAKGRSYRWVK